MRLIHYLVSLCLLAPLAVRAADVNRGNLRDASTARVQMRAILVLASDQPGAPESGLAAFEPTLRRVLRFQSYREAGGGTTAIAMPGGGGLSLGRGQRLELEAADYGNGQVWTRVRWLEGDRELMNTILVLRRGVPAVLGGPMRGEGGSVYAVIVIAS